MNIGEPTLDGWFAMSMGARLSYGNSSWAPSPPAEELRFERRGWIHRNPYQLAHASGVHWMVRWEAQQRRRKFEEWLGVRRPN